MHWEARAMAMCMCLHIRQYQHLPGVQDGAYFRDWPQPLGAFCDTGWGFNLSKSGLLAGWVTRAWMAHMDGAASHASESEDSSSSQDSDPPEYVCLAGLRLARCAV